MLNGHIKETSRREIRFPSLNSSAMCKALCRPNSVFSKLRLSAFWCQKEINNKKTNSRLTIPDILAHHQAKLLVFSLYPGSQS